MTSFVLVLCPQVNPERPSLSLAYLNAFLRDRGYASRAIDLNIACYDQSDAQTKKLWHAPHSAEWTDKDRYQGRRIVDGNMLRQWMELIGRQSPRAVGLSICSTNLFASLALTKEMRSEMPGVHIILGGPEVYRRFSNNELHLFRDADALIVGEGETPLAGLMRRIEAGLPLEPGPGVLINKGDGFEGEVRPSLIPCLDTIPFPAFDDFPLSQYTINTELPLLFSRGCVNRCAFCFESPYWVQYRCRSVQNVVAEIQQRIQQYLPRHFFLNDSLINGNMAFLQTFCAALLEGRLGITWVGMARIHPGMREPFLRTMREAGCRFLTYGVESGSQRVLDRIRKNCSVSLMDTVIRETFSAGIPLGVNLIVGLPGEGESEFLETSAFLERNAPYISSVNISLLGVEPGAELFLEREQPFCDGQTVVDRFRKLTRLASERIRLVSSFEE